MKVLGSSSLCCEMKHPVAWVMTAACSGLGAHHPAAPRLLDPVPRRSSGGRTDLWCECRSVSAQSHIPLLSAPAGDGPRMAPGACFLWRAGLGSLCLVFF